MITRNLTSVNWAEFSRKYANSDLKAVVYNFRQLQDNSFDFDFDTNDASLVDSFLATLTGTDLISSLMQGYVKKAIDGQNYYNLKRSELVSNILVGIITSADAFFIDTKIKNVKDSLLTGDWITAQTYLGLTVVEGAYTQLLKDSFDAEIQDYINNNY